MPNVKTTHFAHDPQSRFPQAPAQLHSQVHDMVISALHHKLSSRSCVVLHVNKLLEDLTATAYTEADARTKSTLAGQENEGNLIRPPPPAFNRTKAKQESRKGPVLHHVCKTGPVVLFQRKKWNKINDQRLVMAQSNIVCVHEEGVKPY